MGSPKSEQQVNGVQDQVLGYLNFSSGNHDPKFLANLNALFSEFAKDAPVGPNGESVVRKTVCVASNREHDLAHRVGKALLQRLAEVGQENETFRDVSQARTAIELTFDTLLPAYRKYHRDLLFHQSDEFLFNSFFVARVFEIVLQSETPWTNDDMFVESALARLNDFLGHRPIAMLESKRIAPYEHEWIRPVPIYVRDSGVAYGRYQAITEHAIKILEETSPHILRAAHFIPEKMAELAIDSRAFDFDHPINQRPNHHFGQWDDRQIDGSGFFRRFIVHQVTLDALLDWVDTVRQQEGIDPEEALVEASAVFAGTMLMASGISGSGPSTYDSNTTLAKLLPVIAGYRDQFYADLLERLPADHRERLKEQAKVKHQPFGAVRQDLNAQLAQRRANQLVNCRLAAIFARMGHPEAADEQSKIVPVAAARINCQIDCLLSAADESIQNGELDAGFAAIPKVMSRLKRGIHCGAIVDPWNILGFDANYSLFPAVENSVRDYRVFDLVDLMDRIFAHCSKIWSEAAASDRVEMCQAIREEFLSIVNWWRKFAVHEVMAVDAVDASDIFEAANLVAEALNLWHKGGAAAGDIEFWRLHADLFDSPKAYALVIDALMQRSDYVTSTALLVHWLSQSEYIPLQQGDSSFHNLVYRWISEQKNLLFTSDSDDVQPEEIWTRIRKFYDFIEANAEAYWNVPDFEVSRNSKATPPPSEPLEQDEQLGDDFLSPGQDDDRDLYGAAWVDVSYVDTTDDGVDGEIFENDLSFDDDLEAEVDRVLTRLEFLSTIAEYWTVAATIPLPINRADQMTEPVKLRLEQRRAIILAWVKQAKQNQEKLIRLLGAVNRYPINPNGSDHDSMLMYDQLRLHKDSLLDQTINTCIETENATRMLVAVIQSIDHLVNGTSLQARGSSEASKQEPEANPDSIEQIVSYFNGGASVVSVYAALLLQDPGLVVENFPALTEYLNNQSLLYVPLSKGGDPAEIVRARVVQTAILDLLRRMPTVGLYVETHELTRTALAMERNNPIGRGAVTEFDEIFEVAYTSMVHSLVQSTDKLKQQRRDEGQLSKKEIDEESQTVLFDCIQMLTESMLILWLEHSKTLRLSVLEKVHDRASWEKLVQFIKDYGSGLFTQQFLHLANIRAILHQGVENWLEQVMESPTRPDLRLFDELGHVLPRQKAARYLALVLESVIENYNEYRDYNTTTTQSDSGESLYMFLDFLRLRSRYDRVCWKIKPVVWAHRILVNDQENAVARMWRRSLTERVGPEADKYLNHLEQLRNKYSIRMASVGRRLEGRFGHQMQIDRLKALVGPAMRNPGSNDSERAFKLLLNESRAFSRSTMGVGIDLPAWLAALENEVHHNLLMNRYRSDSQQPGSAESFTLPIAQVREQLEKLPRRES